MTVASAMLLRRREGQDGSRVQTLSDKGRLKGGGEEMAKQNTARYEAKLELKVNPTIARLVEEANKHEIVALRGFIGPSGTDVVRLYSSFGMTSYVEVPKEAVKHAEESQDGRTEVYVPASTMVRGVRVSFATAKQQPGPPSFDIAFNPRLCALLRALLGLLLESRRKLRARGFETPELDAAIDAHTEAMLQAGCSPRLADTGGELAPA